MEAPGLVFLDTHVAVWLAAGHTQEFGPKVRHAIDHNDLLISPAVYLELEYLYEVKRIKVPAVRIFGDLARDLAVRICDLPFQSVVTAASTERWTKDPFDRLITGHARARGAPLITKDQKIRKHYKPALW